MDREQEYAVLAANRLIEFGRDCASALSTAAEVAESVEAQRQYHQRAMTWTHFCAALRAVVRHEGGAAPGSAGPGGTLQRAWIKIKSGVGDTEAIAAQCHKREADALERCAQAVEQGLPPELDGIVRAQIRDCAESRGWQHTRH
jgi:uncharacterized protein (TIGR02284 family)